LTVAIGPSTATERAWYSTTPAAAERERKNPWVGLEAMDDKARAKKGSRPVAHSIRLRARFSETDAMRIVHHTAYFVWFEVARTEMLRKNGMPYTEVQRRGFNFPLVEAFANYKAPARYDDEVEVRIWTSKVGRSSVRIDYEVNKLPERKLLCTGYTVHVLIGSDGKPAKIPDDLREMLSS
jgi:acyl-CoA thioester hydrolase